MTKFITSKVTRNGSDLPHDFCETVNSGPGQMTLRIRPVEARLAVERGDVFSAWVGWVNEDGEESLHAKVVDGTYKGKAVTAEPGRDVLELVIDAADKRLLVPPLVAESRTLTRLSDALDWLVKEGMGFDEAFHNLEDYELNDPVRVDPAAPWKAALDPLVAAFQPEIFPKPNQAGGKDLWILSVRYPLPSDFPGRPMTVSDWHRLSRTVDAGAVVNWVDILYYSGGGAERPGETCTTTERLTGTGTGDDVSLVGANPGGSPEGHQSTKTWERRRVCTVPDNPDIEPRVVTIGLRRERRDGDGVLISRLVTEKEFWPGSNESVPKTETSTRWGLVNLPGGGTDFLKLEESKKSYVWLFHAPSEQWRPISEDRTTKKEVLLFSRIPLEDASRQGIIGADTAEPSDFIPAEHERTDWTYQANGYVTRAHAITDKLAVPETTEEETSEDYIGSGTLKARTRPTAHYYLEDAESIEDPAVGRRPRVSFDGRPFGLALAIELVNRFLFDARRKPLESCDLEPAPFDASAFRGEVYEIDPDDGTPAFKALCTSERQTVDRTHPDPREAKGATALSLVRLPDA